MSSYGHGRRKAGSNKGILSRRRAARREAAGVRQAARSLRTDAEQLALLGERPGESTRERARLA